MGEISVSDIVFVTFPFSDLIKKKAASLTAAKHHEIITRIQKILDDGY